MKSRISMKLSLDPMPALRLAAVAKVNQHFNELAQPHRDAAHSAKRQAAQAGVPFPDWFCEEADMRGLAPDALAAMILSKADLVATRELARQHVMAAIDTAARPEALTDIVDKLRQT